MVKPLIIIGLDGVPWTALDKTIEKGTMPNLAKVKKEGSHGVMKSTIPYITPVAWSSVQTGMNPGKHGVYGFTTMSQPGKGDTISAGYNIKEKTFLEYLEDNDLKAVFINMPLSHPPKTDFITVGSIFSNIKVFR